MGQNLYESFSDARTVFDAANAALGFDLTQLMFNGPEEELTKTINTQPALLTASIAALRVVESKGIHPSVTAGHSVGEYAALVAAGALDFTDAIRLVRRRGELMSEAGAAQPGNMAAILGSTADEVRAAVEAAQSAGIVDVANFNSPGQVVISGSPEGVEEAGRVAKERGAKRVIPLKVSGAFHSRLMDSAADGMANELKHATIKDPVIPIIANVTANYVRTADEILITLARQIVGSVRWEESVRKMADDGIGGFIELGSGAVLVGLINKTVSEAYTKSVGDAGSLESLLADG
jgi:[acyl-carrier-protein] S-malonyltransferase